MSTVLVYDIEADGLLMDATRIWCIVAKDLETGEVFRYGPDEILQGYQKLLSADRLIGHNVRMYDDRVLFRLGGDVRHPYGCPLSPDFPASVDTILLSRLVYPDKYNNPVGGHKLAKWGEYLGFPKQDFKDFSRWTPEMLDYCENDVEVTERIYKYLLPKVAPMGYATKLEHRVATIDALQVENGVHFFEDRAEEMIRDIQVTQAEAWDDLQSIPPWVSVASLSRPKFYWDPESGKTFKLKGDAPTGLRKALRDGPPQYRVDVTEFNPNSPDHIARFLTEKYDWKPEKLTKTGKPCTDKEVMASLDYPEAKSISRASKCSDALSTTKSWIEKLKDGRLHGDIITTGAPSGRKAHSKPNTANIPKVKFKDKKPVTGFDGGWGYESRRCFGPTPGRVQIGCDGSGMQLRMLAHLMAEYDGGKYARLILESDIHMENLKAASPFIKDRDDAKTYIYGKLFGAWYIKQGTVVGYEDVAQEPPRPDDINNPFWKKLKQDERRAAYRGWQVNQKFMKAFPSLPQVEKKLKKELESNRHIVGLDGRHLPIRREKDCLVTVLQNYEAVCMKQASLFFYETATKRWGPHGKRWAFMLDVHDEKQMEADPDIAKEVGKEYENAIRKAGEFFDLRIRLDGEAKVGPDWSACH